MDMQAGSGPARALPPGFAPVAVGGRTGAVQADLERAMRTLMILPYRQLAALPDARRIAAGRAGPITLAIPESTDRVLIRPYAHGGLLGGLGGRVFRNPRRAWNELAVSHQAAHLGLPVAPLLAVTVTQREDGRYEMEAWSRWLPNASNLTACLPAIAGEAGAKHALVDSAAAALRACQEAGLVHRDLNARNLIAERQPGAWRVLVIDLDRAVIRPPLPPDERLRQVRRLYRSMVKDGVVPQSLSADEFAAFAQAVIGDGLAGDAMRRFMASCRRAAFWHGLLWRVQRFRHALRNR